MVDASIRLYLAELLGMMRDFDAASDLVREARDVFEDLGQRRWLAASEGTAGLLAWWSGSVETAEHFLSSCFRFSREEGGGDLGEGGRELRPGAPRIRSHRRSSRGRRRDRGWDAGARGGESDRMAKCSEQDHGRKRPIWSSGGLALEAVRVAEGTDFVSLVAPALIDLVECRRLAGAPNDPDHLERAAALFERKGDEVGASNARTLLAASRNVPDGYSSA